MTDTATILKEMLTENTGRHMLDSGGAYGRHWERNQGRDFDAEQPTTLHWSKWGPEVTHSVYHWLLERVEYNEELDNRFLDYATSDENEDDSWFQNMRGFVDDALKPFEDIDNIFTVNTYNGEDLLSQTLQYVYWEDFDGAHVLLQIHGGCDVRGGYTRPRAFDLPEEYALFDNARFGLYCTNEDCEASWYSDDGYHLYPNDNEPEFETVLNEDEDDAQCPCCEQFGTLNASFY
jgi:hypothetical protein